MKLDTRENFLIPVTIVLNSIAEAIAAGWIEAELLPEFEEFNLVIYALEDYFEADKIK